MLDEPEPSGAERAIAEHIASFVPDRATLQTGIGGVPSMVARLLAEGLGTTTAWTRRCPRPG